MSLLVSEQRTMPMVGLSPSVRFDSSYMRTYMYVSPTSCWLMVSVLRSIGT